MEFHQLVQEISWVQEFVMSTPTRTPTPMGSALKPICPPSPLVGGGGGGGHINTVDRAMILALCTSADGPLSEICSGQTFYCKNEKGK